MSNIALQTGYSLRRELSAVRAFIGLHYDLTRRYLAWDIVWFVYDLINAFIIGYIGISSGARPEFIPEGQSFAAYLLVGAVMWSYLSVIFYIVADTISMERWEGTLEYTFMAPIHRLTHLTGVVVVGLIYTLVRSVLMIAVLWPAFGLNLGDANWLSAALALIAASIAMTGFSLCAAVMPMLSPEKGSQANHILSAILLLASGVYYPVSALPDWMEPFALVNPVYWSLEALRLALLEGAGPLAMLKVLGILLLSGVAYVPLGFIAFRAAERFAKRTGLLKRAG